MLQLTRRAVRGVGVSERNEGGEMSRDRHRVCLFRPGMTGRGEWRRLGFGQRVASRA
jgi:hypothetical protein